MFCKRHAVEGSDAEADAGTRLFVAAIPSGITEEEFLTYMMEDPRNITPCTHLLFVARNIERIGDLATNIAELIHYQVEGVILDADRPKTDRASVTVVEPE